MAVRAARSGGLTLFGGLAFFVDALELRQLLAVALARALVLVLAFALGTLASWPL